MKILWTVHIVLLAGLAAAGVWVVMQDLIPPDEGGLSVLDGLAWAMYWFAILIFGLLSTLFLALLGRRGAMVVLVGYLVAAGAAVAATLVVVDAGREAAERNVTVIDGDGAAKGKANSDDASANQSE